MSEKIALNTEINYEPLINLLLTQLKTQIIKSPETFEINASNVITIIDCTMRLAGGIKQLDGSQKKELVKRVIKLLSNELPIKEEERRLVNTIIDNQALDLVIDQIFKIAPTLYKKMKTGCANWTGC